MVLLDIWPFYGKVKSAFPCICMGPIHFYGKNVENSYFGHSPLKIWSDWVETWRGASGHLVDTKPRLAQMMILSLVAMTGLKKCCITSAYLQWLNFTQVSELWPVGLLFLFLRKKNLTCTQIVARMSNCRLGVEMNPSRSYLRLCKIGTSYFFVWLSLLEKES